MAILTTSRGREAWVDIRAHGARGDGTDDRPRIQQAINRLNAMSGGGVLQIPPGNYRVGSPINVVGAIKLQGYGYGVTSITALGDHRVINFGPNSGHSSLNDLWIVGEQTATARESAVFVSDNMPIYFNNSRIWGGKWALETNGVDGHVFNCFIVGSASNGGCVLSRGANWYDRAKLDNNVGTISTAFRQDAPYNGNGMMENHFVNSDFSGSFINSVVIADGINQALTAFVNCVLSSPIRITGARHTRFVSSEFGADIVSDAPISVVACYGVAPVSVAGTGTKVMSGNINIS